MVTRFGKLVALVLGICALLSFAQPGSAQADSSLTVHARYCEPGVVPEDPFLECHDLLLEDWAFTVDSHSADYVTGDDGNGTVSGLSEGEHSLHVSPPLKGISSLTYCSVEGGDGRFLELGEARVGISVPVGAGENVICDWYWLIKEGPSAGGENRVEFHVRVCPGYDVPDDFFATCHGTPGKDVGMLYTETSIGNTDDEGNLVFFVNNGAASDFTLDIPGEFATFYLYCSSDADQSAVLDLAQVGNQAEIPLLETGVTCDWYVVSENLQGEVPTPTPGPVTQLPNTGAGTASSSSLPLMAMLLGMAGLAILGGASALRGRQKA